MGLKRNILKAIVLILFCIIFSFEGNCQAHYTSQVSFGVKAGADLSRMFFNPSVKQNLKPGIELGAMFRYVEETHFGIIAELNFLQRGWSENFEGAPFTYNRTIDYLQIPLLAHIYFGRRGKFFVNIGPEIGFRLDDVTHANFDVTQASSLPDFPKYHRISQYSEPVKQKVDYGICAGLGGEFSINPRNSLILETRFYYGLANLFSSKRGATFSGSNSMVLEFTLGYWFRIK